MTNETFLLILEKLSKAFLVEIKYELDKLLNEERKRTDEVLKEIDKKLKLIYEVLR